MDINQLTLGQAKELVAMFSGKQSNPQSETICGLIGQKVIVRAYRAGVHYGTLKSIQGEIITLTNARRLWQWKVADQKGISLSDVADHGLSTDSRICAVVGEQMILDACEVMTTTEKAQESIENANVYRP